MPRQLPIEYPGAIYHVMSREDQREAIFLDAAAVGRRSAEPWSFMTPPMERDAARLRQETTLTIQQIADRLQMGSRKRVGPKLHAWRKTNE